VKNRFWVQRFRGSGFRVQRFRVQGSEVKRFRVQGSEVKRFRVQGFRVQGSAQPLALRAASLIEKVTPALRSF
jgi:hypothetical protein